MVVRKKAATTVSRGHTVVETPANEREMITTSLPFKKRRIHYTTANATSSTSSATARTLRTCATAPNTASLNTEREETASTITSRTTATVSEMNTQGPMQEKPGSLQPEIQIRTIRNNDVVFRKGKDSSHPGNVLFREMCGDAKEKFVGARG